MGLPPSYIFERVCFTVYAAHILYSALTNPNIFGHLTYWSLCLQMLCFSIAPPCVNARSGTDTTFPPGL